MHKHKTFIEAMREHPFLYDVSYPAYHNDKKDNAGIQISQQIKNEQAIAYIYLLYISNIGLLRSRSEVQNPPPAK